MEKLFTTESVTIGHPDKMCDLIADTILDAYLRKDPNTRCACEVAISKNKVFIMGEITSKATINIEKIVRKTINAIGYNNDELLFNGNTVDIIIDIHKQSLDIKRGVDQKELGAGDQGIMYGYATNETISCMPKVHELSSMLAKRLEKVRTKNIIQGLRPDGKVQVTLAINKNKETIKCLVISAQHDPTKDLKLLKEEIIKEVIKKVIPSNLITKSTQIFINPTGRFVIGGPASDSGLTGRKIMVDTYGGLIPHGGGAFSGKDYTKVDRSAAYYARYVAKNIVKSNLASKCLVSVSYAIGVSKPLMVDIETFNTNTIPKTTILKIINQVFDFSPSNIIKELDLKHPIYTKTTLYSHFGKPNLPWEKIDKVDIIKQYLTKISNS